MKKIILIHGSDSSPKKRRYQILFQEFNKLGVELSIPALPGGEHPHGKEWLEIIDREVKNSENPIVLVGHSLGARAVLLYLDKFEKKVDTMILISSPNNDFEKNRKERGGNFADFFDYAVDIEKIKKLANKFIVAHSKDDDSIPYAHGVEIAKQLGAEFLSYENMGHFSKDERAEENAREFLKIIKLAL